jgi:hypothetical protein
MRDVPTKDALMKFRAFSYGVLGSLLLAVNLRAQSSDWQVLQGIPEGAKIKVMLKHRATFGHCVLGEVTDDCLTCYFTALGTRQYARDDIKAVFLGRHSARMGFAVGAGAGVALGATRGCCGGTARVLGVLIFAPVLGGIGAGIGAMVDPFIDGKTVYRSPDAKPEKHKGTMQAPSSHEVNSHDESPTHRA